MADSALAPVDGDVCNCQNYRTIQSFFGVMYFEPFGCASNLQGLSFFVFCPAKFDVCEFDVRITIVSKVQNTESCLEC